MAVNCDPSTLANEARCFDRCIPPGMQDAVKTYLLAVWAGGSLDPNTLMQQAACFRCLDGIQMGVQTYLLCKLLNS